MVTRILLGWLKEWKVKISSNFCWIFPKISSIQSIASKPTSCYSNAFLINIKFLPYLPSFFHKNKFVADFKKKSEFFNSFFAKQCSLINNKRLLPANLLAESCVFTLKFTPQDILRIIQNFDPSKVHDYD